MNVELLQTGLTVGKVGKLDQQAQPAIPFWCYNMDAYSRSFVAACNGGPGGCGPCLGPYVCGGYGPFLPGSWQTYSYSCCSCGAAAVKPAPVVVPAPVVAPAVVPAPVAAPAAATAPVATPVAAPAAAANVTVDPKADCAVHPACQSLKLSGACCPASDGTMLGCCSSTLLETALPVNSTAHPAWCDKVDIKVAPPCQGKGLGDQTSCNCLSKEVCGEGPPKPGSWQSDGPFGAQQLSHGDWPDAIATTLHEGTAQSV